MSKELKPCPFCGGTAALGSAGGQSEVDGYRRAHTVTCNRCGIHKITFSKPYEGPPEDEAIASVIEAWNTRSYEDEYENTATDLGMQILSLEARLSEAVKVLERLANAADDLGTAANSSMADDAIADARKLLSSIGNPNGL